MFIKSSYKRLILPIILVILLLISTLTVTYAWFIEVKRTSSVYFKVGEIEYVYHDQDDDFIDGKIIVPGMDLIKEKCSFSIYNKSTISSELRVLITVSYKINGKSYRHVLGNPNEVNLIYEMALDGSRVQWEYGDNGFWYFQESDTSTILPYVEPNTERKIEILKSLKLNGDYFGNEVSAKNVVIEFTFQAKQSSYAGWTDQNWEELGIVTQSID